MKNKLPTFIFILTAAVLFSFGIVSAAADPGLCAYPGVSVNGKCVDPGSTSSSGGNSGGSNSNSGSGSSGSSSSGSSSSGGSSSGGSNSNNCTDIQNQVSYVQKASVLANQNLVQAQSNLTVAGALNTSNASAALTSNDIYESCTAITPPHCNLSKSSTDGSCSAVLQECDLFYTKWVSLRQSACVIQAEADKLSGITGTTTVSYGPAYSQAFSLTLTPSTIHVGDNFTIGATINATDTSSYTLRVLRNGQAVGNLVSGATVSTTTRPTTVQYTFQAPSNMQPGEYDIQIVNDTNSSEVADATINVLAVGSNTNLSSIITNVQNQTTPAQQPSNSLNGQLSSTSSGSAGLSVSTSPSGACLDLSTTLGYGDQNSNVTLLQDFLTARGYFTSTPTGYFGNITKASVTNFQSDNGISAIGVVGPITRAKIKALTCL